MTLLASHRQFLRQSEQVNAFLQANPQIAAAHGHVNGSFITITSGLSRDYLQLHWPKQTVCCADFAMAVLPDWGVTLVVNEPAAATLSQPQATERNVAGPLPLDLELRSYDRRRKLSPEQLQTETKTTPNLP